MSTARARASKHASRLWQCTICRKVCRGNGGKASHQAMHLHAAGLDIEAAGGLRLAWATMRQQQRGAE